MTLGVRPARRRPPGGGKRNRNVPPQSVSSIVEGILSARGYLSICREHQTMAKWAELVGPEVAKVSACTRVENGVIYVRVSSAAWRQELAYLKRTILDKVKHECASITDIVFG